MPKNYDRMNKDQLIKEVKQEYENHMKMDRLADRRANEIDRLKIKLTTLRDDYETSELRLSRALGYIDRIKDEERIETTAPVNKVKTVSIEPRGPEIYTNRMPF